MRKKTTFRYNLFNWNIQGWHYENIATSPLLMQKIVRNEHKCVLPAIFIRSLPKYRPSCQTTVDWCVSENDELISENYAIIIPKNLTSVKTNLPGKQGLCIIAGKTSWEVTSQKLRQEQNSRGQWQHVLYWQNEVNFTGCILEWRYVKVCLDEKMLTV